MAPGGLSKASQNPYAPFPQNIASNRATPTQFVPKIIFFELFRALVSGAGVPAGAFFSPKFAFWIFRALVSGAGAPAGAFFSAKIVFSHLVSHNSYIFAFLSHF